ncbi:MAG: LamG-like jellyroll fold domain-containing protein [Opitutaceae bacterium]|nr:LamG-like jellyroll fold domain-containing protein [Opitutaceae bacterium]
MHARPIRCLLLAVCVLTSIAEPLRGQTGTGLVRHAPTIDGKLDGSVQQMLPEPFALTGTATVTGNAFVPGTPAIRVNGSPHYGGMIDGAGAAAPSDYEITLGGHSSLSRIVRRTDPVALPIVTAPALPAGTRSVVLSSSARDPGPFATLRDLTLDGNIGQVAVPAGAYGDFVANGGSGFTLGTAGSIQPAVYELQRLTLHAGSKLNVLGPVTLRVANGFSVSGTLGAELMPGWLALNLYSGGLTVHGGGAVYAFVNAPDGIVTVVGAAQLVGGLSADRIVIRGGGLLRLTNRPPVAESSTIAVTEDTSARVVLNGTDPDRDALRFTLTTPPAHGALSGSPPVLTYTPAANYAGSDTFAFKANDGHVDSDIVSIQLTVTPVNDPPTAAPKSVIIAEDVAATVSLSGSDVDGDPLSFRIVAAPVHGVLSGDGAVRTYQPSANYHGADAFIYVATDGELSSEIATANIVITPVNDPPVATNASYAVNEGATVAITLTGSDADSDPLAFRQLTAPTHGTLSGAAPNIVYRPSANFDGVDSFTFAALDAQATSAPGTISIKVTNLDFAPVAALTSGSTDEDSPLAIVLTANDADGDALTFSIVNPPQHGVLGAVVAGATNNSASVIYTPDANYGGTDGFSFKARDVALADSNVAIVSLTVRAVNDPPVAVAQSISVNAGTTKTVTLSATDIEGDALSYAIVSGPTSGSLSGTPPNVTYVANATYSGTDQFTFKANDGRADSVVAAIVIEVLPPLNRPPRFTSVPPASMELRAVLGGPGLLRGTIRDFSKAHSNFEENLNQTSTFVVPGLVAPFIGGDRKPIPLNLGQGGSSTDTAANFNQWYRDVPGVNFSRVLELPIAETTPGSGVYSYRSDSFFPIDNEFYGNEGLSDGQTLHNFNFTCEYHTRFVYQPGQTITFGGDDALWVFVDDRLVIDLGGVHLSSEATASLDGLGLIPGRSYPIDIFHAEQHTGGSSFRLRTSMAFETTETYRYAVSATDPDGDALVFSLTQAPPGMTIDAATGVLTWIVDRAKAGTYPLTIQARDPGGLLDTQSYTLGVYVNSPTTIAWAARYGVGRVGEPVSLVATVGDDGFPASGAVTLQWSKASGPGTVTFSSPNAAATTAVFSSTGIYVLKLAAGDGSMTTNSTCEVRIEIPSDVTTARQATSWWPGNDTPEDVIGGRHAEPLFGASYTTGKAGSAFNLDGVNDIVRVRANPDLDLGASAAGFSIGFWMRCEIDAPMGDMLAWRSETNQLGFSISLDNYLGSRRLGVHLRRADSTDTALGAEMMWLLNDWVHIGFTYDRATGIARLYRNGVLKLEQTAGNIRVHTVADLWWGAVSGFNNNYFRGRLDELMLFRRPLSSVEVFGLFAAGSSGALPPSGNQPPVVNAGADIALRSTIQSVQLGGNVSDDGRPAGGRMTSTWSVLSGPGIPVFADASLANTTVTFPAAGSYVLKLGANDGEASAADTVEVRVGQISNARPPGLIAWWPGNDSGDEVISGLNASWISGPAYSAGVVSDAFSFDGTRQLRVPASARLDSTNSDGLSIEFWWRIAANSGNCTVLQWRNPAGAGGVSLGLWYYYGWRFVVDLNDTSGGPHAFSADGALVADTWQHVVVSYDRPSGVVRVYRNGAQVYQSVIGSFTPQTSYDLYWGNVLDDRFRGGIDELSLYGRALTSEEVYGLYAASAAGKALPGPNLVPAVDAGPDKFAQSVADPVTLGGTVNDDGLPAGNGLVTQWTALSRPGVVNFASATTAATTATFTKPGVYVLQLVADDGSVRTADTVEVRVGPFGAADVLSDLVAWWSANNTPLDVVGSQHALWVGGAKYAPGAIGAAFGFDGARHLHAPASPPMNASTWPGLSIELWVRPSGMPQTGYAAPLLQWRHPNGATGVSLDMGYRYGWNLGIYLTDTSNQSHSLAVGGALMDDAWQHLVIAYDRATGRAQVFRNGSLLSESNLGFFTPQIGYDLLIGSAADARFAGAMDEIAVYRRALSPTQVAAIFGSGVIGKSRPVDGVAPIVNAGPDVMLPGISSAAPLNGSFTDDGRPFGTASVAWSVASAPAGATVTFSDSMHPMTTAMFSAAGIYLLRLTANDGYTLSPSDVMEVRIAPGSAADSPSGIAAWWPGNGTPTDVVNRHDLSLFNGASYAAGRVLQGFAFDGVANFARVDGHADLDLGSSAEGLSIEFWARWDLDADRPLFAWMNADTQTEYSRAWLLSAGRSVGVWLRGTDGQDRGLFGPATLASGRFTHIAVTYDKGSGKGRLYYDGLMVDERSFGSFTADTGPTRTLWIGTKPGDARLYKGVLDEITLYKRALTDVEIAGIAAAAQNGKSPPDDNTAATADAGPDVAVASSADLIPLAGTVVDDHRPFGPPSAQWRIVAGPGSVTFGDAAAASTTAIVSANGTYRFELTGSDGLLAPVTDSVEARVGVVTAEVPVGISAWWPSNLDGRERVSGNAPVVLWNGAGYSSGRVLSGFSFDGVDDFGRVAPHPDIDLGASAAGFTVEFWMKPAQERISMIMSWGEPNAAGLAIYHYPARELSVNFRERATGADHGMGTTGSVLTAGQWTHVAVTQDRGTGEMRIYINGQLRRTDAMGGFAVRTQSGLIFGRHAWDTDWPWQGVIDEPALYRRALTAAEIARIYDAGAAGKCPDLANRTPVVVAGEDRELTALAAVPISGQGTDDGRALPLRYQWTKVSGPGAAQFTNAAAPSTTVSFDATGRYELRLEAYDGLLVGADTVALWAGMPRAADGIAVWWPADSHPREVIRGNHDVTLRNGATYGPGRVADAFQFDGIDDYATVEAHSDLDVGASPAGWTIEWWAKNRGSGTMLYWYTGGVYFQAGAALSGNLRAVNGANYSFDSNGWAASERILLPLETWTHLAVSFDRPTGTLRYYANGVLKRTEIPGPNSALSTSGLGTTGLFHLGVASSFFKGLLDEIALYTRPLSGAEVLDIYQATNGGKARPLNQPPTIAITSPGNNASVAAEMAFTIIASATDADGTISRVEFFRGNESLGLGVATTPGVYEATVGGLPIGQYTLTARATDDDGTITTSAAVSISVVLAGPPFAEISTPDEDVRISAPRAITGVAASPILANWTLEQRLIAPDGAAAEPWIVFASGTTSVGTAPTGSSGGVPGALGTFDPTRLINGIYELRLRAVDTTGRIQVAGPITVVVEGNMKIGAFTLAFEDLKVPLTGIPITITRTYDSRDPRVGDFGPGWRMALNNIRVQKNRHLGTGWWQTPQQGSGFQFYTIEPVRERIVTVVMPDGETHRFRAGALVKLREGDPDNASFAVVVTHGKYRFYPVGDTTSKLEPLNSSNQLAEDFWIGGTGDQDLRAGDPAGDPFAAIFNTTRFRLTTSDGTVFILDEVLGLLEMRDLNGNTLTLNRDAQQRVTSVVSTPSPSSLLPSPTTIVVYRDATGRVDYVRDAAGKDLDYLYDAQGRLASFTNRETNITQFRYELSDVPTHAQFHYLTRVIDPRGVAALRSEYDPVTGRLLKQIDADGKETVFNGGIDSTGRFERVRDRLGNETTFYYDDRGNVTLRIDPLGARATFSYWPDSDRVKFETDHYGNAKSMAYDAQGNVTVQTIGASITEDPATPATGYTTRTSYNARSAPTQITDPDGRAQTFGYDPVRNNLVTHTTGAGGASPATTSYTYKSDGTLATITDALGNLTSHSYNYGFSDPAYPGAVKQIAVTVTDPAGAGGSDPSNRSDTLLRSTRTLFDAQENQLAQITTRTLPNGASEDIVTRYVYDAENRLTATIMPDGRISETRYTSFGKQDKSALWKSVADYQTRNDADARITSYGFDSRGNQTSIIYPDGASELMFFDAENRKTWAQDRRGYRTFFVYDAVGRPRFTIQPDANDGIGAAAPVSVADSRLADNARTETVYDLAGRVTDSYDELRHRAQTVYFPDGTPDASRRKQTIAVRSAGNLVTSYQYDHAGNVRFVTDPRGNTVETRYDDQGRPRFVVYPATDEHPGTQSETRYDALGRRIELVDQEGKVTRYRYDGLGRLTEVRQYAAQSLAAADFAYSLLPAASGVISTRYSYDELGTQSSQTDALGRVTSYESDGTGRRTKRILPRDPSDSSALSEVMVYDSWGNLWKRTDFAGKTTRYTYDALNRLKSRTADLTHPSLGYSHAIARIEFDFDANGARIAARTFRADGTQLYSESTPRDERGRLGYKDTGPALSGVEGGGRLDYSYYSNGLLKDVVSSNSGGVNIGYRYDEVNRLEFVDDTSTGLPTRTTGYGYNTNGSIESVTLPNAVVHTYAYDTLNRLRTLNVTRGSTSIHAYDYKLRASGHRRQVIENATKSTTYTYDDLYRLTGETITGDPNAQNGSIGYDLDKVGNRLNRTSQIAAVTAQLNQSYNARDWLGGDTYNANGSTLTAASLPQPVAPSSPDVYDFEERLIVRTRADGSSVNITYDADGHRIRKNIMDLAGAPVSSTSWLVDVNNLTGYAQVVEERVSIPSAGTTQASLRTVVYTYGSDLISQATSADGHAAIVSYYARDGHGSTRELADNTGTTTDRYTYDAFGILVFRSGTTPNAYLYTGEQFDPDLGLYYLRARYLNPESGRLWSMDDYGGEGDDPMSLHKYVYANANPATYSDPSGHVSIAEIQIGMVIVSTLNSLALNSGRNTISQGNGIFSPTGELNTALATFEQAAFIYEQVTFAMAAGGAAVLAKRMAVWAANAMAPMVTKALATLSRANPAKLIQAQLGRFHRATAQGAGHATRYDPSGGILDQATGSPSPLQSTIQWVGTLDFSTPPNMAIFYSGQGQGARAASLAASTGGITIDKTVGGRALLADPVFQSLSRADKDVIWQRASVPFAQGASGRINAFIRGADPARTFRMIEEPILKSNHNVFRSIYHY